MEGKTEYAMLMIVVVLLGAAGVAIAQEGGGLGRQIANFFTDQENLETTVPLASEPPAVPPTPALEPPGPPSDADSSAPPVAPPRANTPQATPTPAQQSKPPSPPSDADSAPRVAPPGANTPQATPTPATE